MFSGPELESLPQSTEPYILEQFFFFFPSQDESVFIFVGFLLKSSSLVKLSAFSEKLQGFDIKNFG